MKGETSHEGSGKQVKSLVHLKDFIDKEAKRWENKLSEVQELDVLLTKVDNEALKRQMNEEDDHYLLVIESSDVDSTVKNILNLDIISDASIDFNQDKEVYVLTSKIRISPMKVAQSNYKASMSEEFEQDRNV